MSILAARFISVLAMLGAASALKLPFMSTCATRRSALGLGAAAVQLGLLNEGAGREELQAGRRATRAGHGQAGVAEEIDRLGSVGGSGGC